MYASFSVTLEQVRDLSAVQREWLELERRSEAPVFLSWLWLGSLLKLLPPEVNPELFRVTRSRGTVVLGLIFRSRPRWRGLLPVPSIYLNETGDDRFDRICTEYNGFLVDRSEEMLIDGRLYGLLAEAAGNWKRLHLSGVPAALVSQAASETPAEVEIHSTRPTYNVDLALLRGCFIDQLGPSTRAALRRSLRLYRQRGDLRLTIAPDAAAALAYFDEMVALHQRHWSVRGQPGAFAEQWVLDFHRKIIKAGVPQGSVWMTRITNAGRTLGVLYNFRWRGRISSYQTGFAYETSRDARPGMVAHYLAIEYARANGATCYDFLAGENRLKRELGQRGDDLVWIRFRRDRTFHLLDSIGRMAFRWVSSTA